MGGRVYPSHPSNTLSPGYPTSRYPNPPEGTWDQRYPILQIPDPLWIPYPQLFIPYPILDTLPPRNDMGPRDQWPGRDLVPEIPDPPPCEQIDRHLWKHYLPATTVADSNYTKTSAWNWGRFWRNIFHIMKCFRASEALWCTCMTLPRCFCKSLWLHWPNPGSAVDCTIRRLNSYQSTIWPNTSLGLFQGLCEHIK